MNIPQGGRGVQVVEAVAPANLFYNPSAAITRNASGTIATIARTQGSDTQTVTFTRNASDEITAISAWVES